jgi:hypothetical protein
VRPDMERPMLIVRRIEPGFEPPPDRPPIEPPPGGIEPPPGPQPPPGIEPPPQGPRGGGLSLQVFGRDRGKTFPLAGCQVRVTMGRRTVFNGGTDRGGRTHARLGNGSYQVTVLKEGFQMGRTGVVIRGRAVHRTVYLDRQPGRPPGGPGTPPPSQQMASLHVRVMVTFPRPPKPGRPGGFATTPGGGAQVSILQNGRRVASGKTDGGGNYRVRLRTGRYEIRVTHGSLRRNEPVTLGGRGVSRTITLQSGAAVGPPPRRPGNPGNQIRPPGRLNISPLRPPAAEVRPR